MNNLQFVQFHPTITREHFLYYLRITTDNLRWHIALASCAGGCRGLVCLKTERMSMEREDCRSALVFDQAINSMQNRVNTMSIDLASCTCVLSQFSEMLCTIMNHSNADAVHKILPLFGMPGGMPMADRRRPPPVDIMLLPKFQWCQRDALMRGGE